MDCFTLRDDLASAWLVFEQGSNFCFRQFGPSPPLRQGVFLEAIASKVSGIFEQTLQPAIHLFVERAIDRPLKYVFLILPGRLNAREFPLGTPCLLR